ncbi:hypothetical protein SAMN05444123_11298 [Rhodopseudomonas pseudopalustris]|uniref:Uncharacterized protein n=1 Tax=Rhodopseudomonas pseudopalustris TaxID=1513892 RepID=A0A1H8WHH8_9BRAD|nr:hypothetical protein SAMN05444123_11298 [Rhodopseudomonas pseudopalustris]
MWQFGPIHNQRGSYNSAEHESLRAVVRSVIVHGGRTSGCALSAVLLGQKFPAATQPVGSSHLTPEEAREMRRVVEALLPPVDLIQ